MKLPRKCAPLATVVLAGALALAAAPAAAKDEPKKESGKPLRVAILPVTNATQELSATKIMGDVLREQLAQVPAGKATFLLPFDSERILTEHGQLDRAFRVTDRWSKMGVLDSTSVAAIDSILMVDAILLVKVAEWENHRVAVVGTGESSTTIGLSLACYDARSMKPLWKKTPREQRFGQEIDPGGNVGYDETGFIQSKHVTDPPRYEEVAADLIRDAFKKFPK